MMKLFLFSYFGYRCFYQKVDAIALPAFGFKTAHTGVC